MRVAPRWSPMVAMADDAADPRMAASARDPNRCSVSSLDKYAGTRAQFSMEAGSGVLGDDALVDISGCQTGFAGKDLREKVMSGVLLQDADFHGASFVGDEFARAQAQGANLQGADFTVGRTWVQTHNPKWQ